MPKENLETQLGKIKVLLDSPIPVEIKYVTRHLESRLSEIGYSLSWGTHSVTAFIINDTGKALSIPWSERVAANLYNLANHDMTRIWEIVDSILEEALLCQK